MFGCIYDRCGSFTVRIRSEAHTIVMCLFRIFDLARRMPCIVFNQVVGMTEVIVGIFACRASCLQCGFFCGGTCASTVVARISAGSVRSGSLSEAWMYSSGQVSEAGVYV